MGFSILVILLLFSNCFFFVKVVDGSDYLVVNQSLSSNDTLVSSRGIFELGFFTPGNSLKEYIGIWYYKDKSTVIWVANRQLPVVKTPGKLILQHNGMLEISDRENTIIWSSNTSESVLKPVAQLLDTGNFVVGDKFQIAFDQFIWQGFDYPCDTRLAKMKTGYDKRRKRNVYESSWKSLDDPAEGEYEFKIDSIGIPQGFLMKASQETLFRTGPWNGETFGGIPHVNPDSFFRVTYIDDDDWLTFLLEPINSSVLMRSKLYINGTWLHFVANENSLDWKNDIAFVNDNCDTYNWCGPYASCNIHETPICKCLTGYVPKSSRDWHIANWTKGCVRSTPVNCSTEDKFYKLSNIKTPDTRNAYGNLSWSLEECKMACLVNCSCTAYGNMYVSYGGKGCFLWFGELKDIKVFPENGQHIYVRGDYPVKGIDLRVITICATVSALVLVFVMIFIISYRRKKTHEHRQRGIKEEMSERGNLTENNSSDLDLPLFDSETISRATNNFSAENKLGQGGFGPVYKGLLEDGQEVAVKKLSQDSKQGSNEFRNEAMCIAKLQHRNLVKLLGCCIQEEYMLIYEFMSNKSLDLFIFDHKERTLLDWPKRINIINGIARGLLYLHQDSRLRIIHRDLKASNILLDSDMNPKISDFGLARICGGAETAANTTRVVGTYGYMSPEYAIDGLFSVKSDVYSFGVLVLEIISGRGNRGFYHSDHHLNLLGHVWKLFNEERYMEAVDETLTTSYDPFEITRAIHVGLLCVQESPQDRPTMASVVLMLSSDTKLPHPKAPGFFTARKIVETDSLSSKTYSCSVNVMSVSMMDPR